MSDTLLKQARTLEDLRLIERLKAADRAAHSSMTRDQQIAFAKYLNSHRRKEDRARGRREEIPIPLCPSAWLIQQRLDSATDPWVFDAEVVEQVSTPESKNVIGLWMADKDRKIGKLENEIKTLPFHRRGEEARLKEQLARAVAELKELESLDDLERYGRWSEEVREKADGYKNGLDLRTKSD